MQTSHQPETFKSRGTMDLNQTCSSAVLKSDFEMAGLLGIPLDHLEQVSGIARHHLNNSDDRIPLPLINRFWHSVMSLSKNPAFALIMGEQTDPKKLGLFGNIIMNCTCADDIFRLLPRYYSLARGPSLVRVEEKANTITILFDPGSVGYPKRYVIEKFFATTISCARSFAETEVYPEEMRFRHSPVSYAKEYERIFNCPISFNQPENAMVLKADYRAVRFPQHNPDLRDILIRHADTLICRSEEEEQIQFRVRQVINDHLDKGDLDIEMVSDYLNVSRWTLNRWLKKHGTSFKNLLTDTRKQQAVCYLRKSELTINEIAYRLGFSDPFSFPRAFKRWFGTTPSEYRLSSHTSTLQQ